MRPYQRILLDKDVPKLLAQPVGLALDSLHSALYSTLPRKTLPENPGLTLATLRVLRKGGPVLRMSPTGPTPPPVDFTPATSTSTSRSLARRRRRAAVARALNPEGVNQGDVVEVVLDSLPIP